MVKSEMAGHLQSNEIFAAKYSFFLTQIFQIDYSLKSDQGNLNKTKSSFYMTYHCVNSATKVT